MEKNLRPESAPGWSPSCSVGPEKVASLQEIDADKLDALRNLVDAYPTVLEVGGGERKPGQTQAPRAPDGFLLKPSELRDRGKHPLARGTEAPPRRSCSARRSSATHRPGAFRPFCSIRQAGFPLADIATLAQCPEAQFEKGCRGGSRGVVGLWRAGRNGIAVVRVFSARLEVRGRGFFSRRICGR